MSATQAEPIAFETAGCGRFFPQTRLDIQSELCIPCSQVEELLERLQESLQNTLHAHRASSSKSAEYNDEVERRVQEVRSCQDTISLRLEAEPVWIVQRFEYMRQALLSNVTVAGQPYHEEKPTGV